MKNFTQQLKTTILLSVLVLMAFTVKAQNDYFIKNDGTKVNVYGEGASYDFSELTYTDENGKVTKIKNKDVKLVVIGGSVVMSLPESPKNKWTIFQTIVAFNDKYVLTGRFYSGQNANYVLLNILDREFNFVLDEAIRLTNRGEYKRKEYEDKNRIILNDNIFKYFKDCPELHEKMLKNLDDFKLAYSGIDYYNCNNVPDLLTNKKVKSSEVNQEIKVENIKKKINFYVNTKNEKIDMNEFYAIAVNEKFKYHGNSLDYAKSIPIEEIKYADFGSKIYAPINIEGKKYMVEIIGFNNNFVLFGKYKADLYEIKNKNISFGIYDRKNNTVIDEIIADGDINLLLDKYFKDCMDLKNIINDNLKNHRKASYGFTYFNCNKSKELIEGIELE